MNSITLITKYLNSIYIRVGYNNTCMCKIPDSHLILIFQGYLERLTYDRQI